MSDSSCWKQAILLSLLPLKAKIGASFLMSSRTIQPLNISAIHPSIYSDQFGLTLKSNTNLLFLITIITILIIRTEVTLPCQQWCSALLSVLRLPLFHFSSFPPGTWGWGVMGGGSGCTAEPLGNLHSPLVHRQWPHSAVAVSSGTTH